MDTSRLTYLVSQWQQSALTEGEQHELTAFLADPANREQFVSLMSEQPEDEGAYAFNSDTWMPVINNVLQADKLAQPALFPEKRRPFIRWYAAAAAAAVLIGLVTLYTVNKRNAQPPLAGITTLKPEDVAPGQDVAILTLADGTHLKLDSAAQKTIRQGQTVVNQQNGQLQYVAASKPAEVVYNTLTVPRGGQFQVVLPDGSKVWLNAASSLKYPTAFTGDKRTVEIQGQGYFEVAANASQPFIVKVNDMEVQVLGTSFDIMAYPDEKTINTTLLDGAVRVSHGSTSLQLRPGQQAVLDNATFNAFIRQVDADQVIAWKTGFFEFDNENLATIMRQVSRWYDIEVDLKDMRTARRFGGRISRRLPLSEILNMLESSGAGFELKGRKLEVTTTK